MFPTVSVAKLLKKTRTNYLIAGIATDTKEDGNSLMTAIQHSIYPTEG